MTALWAVLAAMAAVALALLLPAALRRGGGAAARSEYDAQVYRDQLAEIERDRERAAIGAEEAAAARAEIARRLLAADAEGAAEAGAHAAPPVPPSRAGRLAALAAVGAVPAAALALYVAIGSPGLPGQPAAERAAARAAAHPGPDGADAEMSRLVEKLGEKLKGRPDDLEGWSLYARTLSRLGRLAEAVPAWRKVVALAPRDTDALSQLAEAEIAAASGVVGPSALSTFEAVLGIDPAQPRARYYVGLASLQAGDVEAALERWLALEADSAPDAPWRRMLAERIQRVAVLHKLPPEKLAAMRTAARAKRGPRPAAPSAAPSPALPPATASAAPRGPSADDVKAAASMDAGDRQAMIRSMVDRLAARLEANPNDAAGWRRLERAWRVLGETAKADAASARLRALTETPSSAAPASPPPAAAPPAAVPVPRGPSADDVKAAASMDAGERQAMIRSMVGRRAARLEQNPDDADGWARLGRSWGVLGEHARARDAWARASALRPADVATLEGYIDAIVRTATPGGRLPDDLFAAAARLTALRPDHPTGLWFTGLGRLQAGDTAGALDRWKHLRALLDPASPQFRDLSHRIEALEKPPAGK